MITLQVHSVSKDPAALIKLTEKLDRQFAHAPAHKLISLIKGAGSPWSDDPALTAQIKKTVVMCSTCNLYKKPPPCPTVGLPLATCFQETVAMDLKFYEGKIIPHLIDHATRLSQAVHIPSKHPRVITEALLTNWISIYGPADKSLTDNEGEFVNNKFFDLCEQFNIVIVMHTTAAASSWSNGLMERHNLILADILNKVIADTGCSFNVALQWCATAKNSLQNVHGFSPYQLALGQNPKLPALLTNSLPAQKTKPSSFEIVQHHLNALHKAREVFIQSENSAKLIHALTHSTRTSNDSIFINGDKVYYIARVIPDGGVPLLFWDRMGNRSSLNMVDSTFIHIVANFSMLLMLHKFWPNLPRQTKFPCLPKPNKLTLPLLWLHTATSRMKINMH